MFDSVDRRELLEMTLRPLGALGTAAEFRQDRAGIEALIGRLPEGRPSERRHFAYEGGKALPRYDGEYTTWLSPAGEGCLRVRREHPWELSSVGVVLHPDGRIGEFEPIEGFGVPDSELTERARTDRSAFEHREREREVSESEGEERREADQTRFSTENLIRAVAAPAGQDQAGPVVSYVTLYETGVMVSYLVPRPSEEVLDADDPDDPFAEPEMEAMFPEMKIEDDLGTKFKVADIQSTDMNGSPLRAGLSYMPAVPASARALYVVFDSVSVEIDLEAP